MPGQRIAVVGGGISGNLVARLLHPDHDVTLFEADNRPGGHSHTVACEMDGKTYEVDTGFMVFNERTYPNFCRLLDKLAIASQDSDMSFSVRCAATGLEYQGSSLRGLFPAWKNVASPEYWRMLRDIARFNRAGTSAVVKGLLEEEETVGQFLTRLGMGSMFRSKYLLPMAAAIWSADPQQVLKFPARFLLGFFHNHGLMSITHRPQWKTVAGRSQSYVRKLLEPLGDRVQLGTPVRTVFREPEKVTLLTESGLVQTFDRVIFACHADQTLKILSDPTPNEREILAAFPYQANEAVLHTDTSILPTARCAWASWNYLIPSENQQTASVTYDLSRLQRIGSPRPVLLSLNSTERVNPATIQKQFVYHHPAYNLDSWAAQKRLPEIQALHRTYFCGAWCGYGFHEDGVNSALAVAAFFGKTLDACEAVSTKATSTTFGAVR